MPPEGDGDCGGAAGAERAGSSKMLGLASVAGSAKVDTEVDTVETGTGTVAGKACGKALIEMSQIFKQKYVRFCQSTRRQ